jgi:hypothetical protein
MTLISIGSRIFPQTAQLFSDINIKDKAVEEIYLGLKKGLNVTTGEK